MAVRHVVMFRFASGTTEEQPPQLFDDARPLLFGRVGAEPEHHDMP